MYQLSLFSNAKYPLPTYTEGQRVRVYDADEWERFNGIEGEIISVSVKRRAYIVLLENGEVEIFLEREVMNVP